MSLDNDVYKFNIGTYVELIDLDLSPLTGDPNDVWYITTMTDEAQAGKFVVWRGEQYIAMPVSITGVSTANSGAVPRANLLLSNVDKFMIGVIRSLGLRDISGARVTRWRTLSTYLDNGATPDVNVHFPVELYIVTRMNKFDKDEISYTIGSVLDQPGLKLPKRQALKDIDFPGMSRSGSRQIK